VSEDACYKTVDLPEDLVKGLSRFLGGLALPAPGPAYAIHSVDMAAVLDSAGRTWNIHAWTIPVWDEETPPAT
jgi:hypothetical protein